MKYPPLITIACLSIIRNNRVHYNGTSILKDIQQQHGECAHIECYSCPFRGSISNEFFTCITREYSYDPQSLRLYLIELLGI